MRYIIIIIITLEIFLFSIGLLVATSGLIIQGIIIMLINVWSLSVIISMLVKYKYRKEF